MTLTQAADRVWDVLVVGAGPSGAMAARELARAGASILLVDQASFPRRKVCGGCLNAVALATLEAVGLGDLPGRLGARPLGELRLAVGGRIASIPLPPGVALSREAFDAALVEQAVRSGTRFLPNTLATLDGIQGAARRVRLRSDQEDVRVEARVVLAADGLGGRLLQHERDTAVFIAPRSRVGVGTMVGESPSWLRPGTIFMACGSGGYVGLVQVEGGRLDVAAALDPSFVRNTGGPGAAVARILTQAGLPPVSRLTSSVWRGTPALTRQRARVAADRLFVLGDAAGYVEPFTGEGIAWALASGVMVSPLALAAVRRWTPSLATQWMRRHRRLLGRRQLLCRLVTGLLRHVALTHAAVGVLSWAPALAAPVVRFLNTPGRVPLASDPTGV